ncbi:MAG: hypothetical protein EHM35_01395, partial [Planctomycetaceae bacterium]
MDPSTNVWVVSFNPNLPPGLPALIGERARVGSTIWFKTGPLDTDWTLGSTVLAPILGDDPGIGPTAVGTVGTGIEVARENQTHRAYRSDLPLSATWFVDPVNGSDAITNAGTTSATALRSLNGAGGLKERWWGAEITQNTTVTILGNLSSTDTGSWSFTIKPGAIVTFIGSLGATTGFGGAAVDNTLYTGTVTGFVGMANAPTADDIELTDSAIPVSYTASGLLASGVLFRRNSGGAVVHWYALKDLASKTIRITSPFANTGQNNYQTLTNGDGYSAYAMWQFPSQQWG